MLCVKAIYLVAHSLFKKATANHAPLAAVLTSNTSRTVRLGYGLIMNHPFVDGNKRIGTHAMLVLLALNGIELRFEQEELSDEILAVASGTYGYEHLLQWVIGHQT